MRGKVNQSNQKVGEGSKEDGGREKKSEAGSDINLPVNDPVVEEGPVEPEVQEVRLSSSTSIFSKINFQWDSPGGPL